LLRDPDLRHPHRHAHRIAHRVLDNGLHGFAERRRVEPGNIKTVLELFGRDIHMSKPPLTV
jgi:hypothetical protein